VPGTKPLTVTAGILAVAGVLDAAGTLDVSATVNVGDGGAINVAGDIHPGFQHDRHEQRQGYR
jgi:hypothetical protein